MTAIFEALKRLDGAIDRNRQIKKVRPVEKSGDKKDVGKERGSNGDRKPDTEDLICISGMKKRET